jgi:hypothetical protein
LSFGEGRSTSYHGGSKEAEWIKLNYPQVIVHIHIYMTEQPLVRQYVQMHLPRVGRMGNNSHIVLSHKLCSFVKSQSKLCGSAAHVQIFS